MGLDIYLYRYTQDRARVLAAEEAYETFSEQVWAEVSGGKKYDELTEAQRAEARARTAAYKQTHGLGEWGEPDGREKVELDSPTYPKHMCKIGYLRSSYNEGGFERVAGNLTGKDWHYVFQPADRYEFAPDWDAALVRARELLAAMRAAKPYRVTTFSAERLTGPTKLDSQRALAIFLEEQARHEANRARFPDREPYDYSNAQGTFFMAGPLAIRGVIGGQDVLGRPAVHVVYEADVAWYVEAAAITVELIEWALAQPDRDQLYLHWSS